MSTVSMSNDGERVAAATGPLIRPMGWLQIGVLASLFVYLFWHVLFRAYGMGYDQDGVFVGRGYAWSDANWSHAFIVPLISLYFIYQHKDQLAAAPRRIGWPGLALLLVGIAGYFLGIYPIRNDMAKGYSMILALAGLVWFLNGWAVAKLVWFPIAYLVFAVKVSDRLWEVIAFKLQTIAAQASGVALNIFGLAIDLEAEVVGNHIHVWHEGVKIGTGMNIAEACSGLRMLMTFIALGVAVAYLADRPWWVRLIMVLLTVPIAILVNVGRVTTLGMIYPFDQEASQGDFHVLIGMMMLIPAGLLFLLVGWVLNRVFISDDEGKAGAAA